MSKFLDTASFSLTFALIAFAFFVLAKLQDKNLIYAFGAIFALHLGLDDLLTAIGNKSQYSIVSGEWNWSGKIYSLILSAALIAILRIDKKATGLVMPYKNNGSSLIATIILISLSATLAVIFKPDSPSLETLAFQATMPGIAEELTYRGIAPAIFLGLVNGRTDDQKMPWTAILVTALMFSVWHGLGLKSGSFSFDIASASFTLVGGLAYGWLRFNSGSLLYPIIAHCAGNLVFQLVPLIGT